MIGLSKATVILYPHSKEWSKLFQEEKSTHYQVISIVEETSIGLCKSNLWVLFIIYILNN